MVLLGIVSNSSVATMESLLDSLKGPWKIIISVSKLKVTACGRYIPFSASFSSSLLNQWASQKLQLGISDSWRLSVFSLNWTNMWDRCGHFSTRRRRSPTELPFMHFSPLLSSTSQCLNKSRLKQVEQVGKIYTAGVVLQLMAKFMWKSVLPLSNVITMFSTENQFISVSWVKFLVYQM